ncbi:MAG: hypothetical protein U0350_50165 [Caldilineaceae bacterium]
MLGRKHFFALLLLAALIFSLCQPILAQPQRMTATTAVTRLLVAPDPINAKPAPKDPPWPLQCPAAPGIPPCALF